MKLSDLKDLWLFRWIIELLHTWVHKKEVEVVEPDPTVPIDPLDDPNHPSNQP